ncbi:MAG: right-handed parallel beta-helix repeat-containing protein [Chitinophagaceae bacterium]|nr:right-handed parallel beta-helix repeat-containing protein [Chitinophagaceae bacterium]
MTGFISLFFSHTLSAQTSFAGNGNNSLTGAYTINKAIATGGTNFNSFADFSTALTATGVTGNVTATVVAGSGPYNEQVIFQNISGIGAGATLTIEGNGETITSDTAIIQTGSNPNRHIIRLIGLQYFTVNNLHIDMFPGSTGFIGVHILNSGNNIAISNCVVNMGAATSTLLGAFVANGTPSGILTPGGTFDLINITGNTVTGGGYGASVVGLASPLATNIVISNNNFNDFNSNGVYLRETNGAVVSANHFDKSAGSAASTNAIQLAQAANINGRIFGNFIRMSQTTGSLVGIYLFNGTGHKVYNNLIYDIRSTTGNIEGIRVRTGATAPEIYFNTISFDNATATTGSLRGFREELSNTGSILRNNIFSITQTTSSTRSAIELASTSVVTTAINSNYNVFWVPGGNVAMRGATAYATLSAWRTASTQDAASFDTDPFFVSNINPVPRSAVINNQAVTGTGITTDITGAARGAAPDPGAYEFSPPSGDAAMTGFILPPIPHCANTLDVQFELTNAGGDPLNSVTINWTVNGVPQTSVNWTGPSLPPGLSTIVTLGTVPVTGSNMYNFSATSSNPNGGPDSNPANDSYTYNGFRRGFEGAFTINVAAPASATNFQTFQNIANALSQHGVCSPVNITVMNGSYFEQVVFNAIPGTSPVNTVTLNGNNQVLEFNPTVATSDHILQLNGVTHMIVENLRVTSLHLTQGRGIHITNGASKLAIRNNIVNVSLTNSTSSAFGIIISGANWLLDGSLSDSVIIENNTVSGGYSAIQLSGVHWTQPLTRISVINNNVLDWYGFGVYLSYTNGALVSKNTIRRPLRSNSGSDAVTPAGITVPAGSLTFLLEKNRIYDLHVNMPGTPTISRGVHMSGTTTAPTSGTIQNNLIYGMNNDGAQYGIQNNSVTGPVNIYHNTIVLNNATGAGTSNTNAINLSNTTVQNGIDMRNNIFIVTRGGTGVKRIYDVSATSAPFISDYNVSYLNAPGGTQTFAQVGSTNYNTLIDWQVTGKDLNSVSQDPLFVSPGTGNFTPTNFLVDGTIMGTSVVGGITDDILDQVRSANPDAGAYEFSLPACSSPVGGTANTVAGPFCGTGSGTIAATGYSTGFGFSYQWQYSSDNFVTDINDLAGQTNPATAATGVITSTTYYRLRVTCSTGPVSAFSNIVSITVTPAPAANIAYTGSPYCTVAGTATVTRTGTAGGSYSAIPAGLTLNAVTGDVTLGTSTPGTYTVTYTVPASGGCPVYTTTTGITVSNCTDPCTAITTIACTVPATATLTGSGIWSPGSCGFSTPGNEKIYSFTPGITGVYTLQVTSTSSTGFIDYFIRAASGGCNSTGWNCILDIFSPTTASMGTLTAGVEYYILLDAEVTSSVTHTFQVNCPCPAATIIYTGSPYCSTTATAPVTRTGTAGGTYSAAPAGLTINASTGTVTPNTSTPGTYTVTYTIAAAGGCPAFSTTAAITITPAPNMSIIYNGSPYCSNAGTAAVTQMGTAGGTYSAAPAGLSINATTGAVTLGTSTPGTYSVTYTIPAGGGCGITFTTTTITVTAAPAATISYTGSPYCSNAGTAAVTRTGTAGGTYSSTAGLTINSTTGAVTLGTSTPGTYTVTYTIAAGGGCATFTTTASITITALPAATISYAGSPYCSNAGTASVTRTGTAGGVYSSGAGLSINAATGAVTLGTSTPGTYTVTYTFAAGSGCPIVTATTSITITNLPAATISYAGSPYCQNAGTATVTRTGAAGGVYSSAAGLSINAATGDVTLGTSTPGTYTVTYTIAAGGGCPVVTATATIIVSALSVAPTAANASATTLCGPGNVTLSVTGGSLGAGATWRWYSTTCGGTAVGTGATLNVAVNATTTYFVRAEGACNTTTCASVTVTVNTQPAISIAAAPGTVLKPFMTTTLTATVTPAGNTITWYRNGIVVPGANSLTLVVHADELGQYTARVTATTGCTALSNAITITAESSNQLFITPNPNNGQFKVRFYTSANALGFVRHLVMFAENGQKVFDQTYPITAPYSSMDIDARRLPKGIYIVMLTDAFGNEVLATGKVIIQ